ncbi:MAG: tRNA (N6-isopentenyl adenosine(37)-C2)-methylthiotransferase MiaB [Nitrospirota bacterium]
MSEQLTDYKNSTKKVYIKTFGCQMNEHDSERIAGLMAEAGYDLSERPDDAQVIILNSCSVREKAYDKLRSEIGRFGSLKKNNPGLVIGVGGCVAQQEGKRLLGGSRLIDFVFGPRAIHKVPEIMERVSSDGRGVVEIGAPGDKMIDANIKRDNGITAWVSIMEGCDNYCSYCVVPYTRGREVSRPSNNIINEIEGLASDGFKEVTLLGQNVSSYGKGLSESVDFPTLLSKIEPIEGIERIRFITSHPRDLSVDLIDAMAKLSKVCEHIHLPLQSGSDKILEGMNRGYTYEEYRKKIDLIRNRIPSISVSTDIIVGFPGEYKDDFHKTKDALLGIGYDNIYLFRYSRRPNTAALSLDGHLPEDLKIERLEEILLMQREIASRKNGSYIGRSAQVLFDGQNSKEEGGIVGRTRTNKVVYVKGSRSLIGHLKEVKIVSTSFASLRGELLENSINA